tara:strand:+ start:39 stop:1616 length:1578 start_codon:yes stop_codon:yes gene_type:complete
MKSFRQFIIEKGPIDITGPDGKPTKKSEKFLRNLQKKGANKDPELSPNTKAGIESDARKSNLGGYDDGKPTSVRGNQSQAEKKANTKTYNDHVKQQRIEATKERLKNTLNKGESRADKYKTNKPPTGKQVQQFAKDITGKAADDKSGVGGKPGVGQTKSVKGQTITKGKYKGATPIDKRSATKLRKFAKDSAATENPFSGKSDKRTLKTSARRVTQKWETAKKAASKYNKNIRKQGAELLKDIQNSGKKATVKNTELTNRMDKALSTSKKPGTLSNKTDKLIDSIRRKGTPKSTPIKNTSSPSNINIDSRYKSSVKNTSFGVDTSKQPKFNVSNKVVKPPKIKNPSFNISGGSKQTTGAQLPTLPKDKVTTGKGPTFQGPNKAPKVTLNNFLSKASKAKTLSKVKGVAKRVPGPLGVAVGALDYGTTYANEKKKGRTSAGAHLATAAKVTSGIAGGIVGGAFGSGVASLATGALGYSVARGATSNFIDTVFKPKNAPAGALPKKPKKRKPVTLNVSLDSKGKLTK